FFSTQLFAEQKVWLTWKNDPTSTMTVMWISPDSEKNDEVHYKKSDKADWKVAKGKHWKLPNRKPFLVHKVDIQGLDADTIYNFHLGDKSKTLKFRTMPTSLIQPIRFVTGGDAYHKSLKRYQAMCRQAAKQNPRFAIIGGDIAYAVAKKDSEEDWKKWQEFFGCWSKEMRDKDGCLIPLLVTIGNHEVTGSFNRSMNEASFYYMFFEKATYALNFGNYAHFTFLDSNHTQKIHGKQTDWLAKTLKNSRNQPHRFAIYHVGAYPSSGKIDSQTSRLVRKHWVPLFEKYKVNACFESHDHAYKRTHPLLKGKKASDGVVYIGDGSWGVPPRTPKKRDYLAVSAKKQQALVVELSSTKRTFKSVDPDGKVIDTYEQAIQGR
ncbi:MAG: metallophosphoesterase family protein, partial [Verrucomicrobia bacterium]|nr:metallophosphoesterase family protein [Verrucomicrobiota bacterium]